MQLWSPSQRLPMVDQQLGEMPKLEAQLNELTNRSLRVVNSASFFLLSELVSVFACNPVMSPLHLLCGVSSQLGFSPQLLVLGIKWGFTGWVRLYRSTNGERIWLPVSFPFKFSKSPRLCVLLYIQATRRKKKKKKSSITQLFVKVKLLPLCASSKLSECWSDSQMAINHPCTGCIAVVIFRESVSVLPFPFNS